VTPELAHFLEGMSLYGSLGPFTVLADWLQSNNDPWGELISLQCLRTNDPTTRDRRVEQLIAELAPRLWPGDDFLVKSFWRGFVSSIQVKDSEGPQWLGAELARLLDADGTALCTEISFRNLELGDGNVPMLLGLRDRLYRMTRIDFDGNWFGTEAVARLRETYPYATFEHQGPDTAGGGLGRTW